MYLHVETNPAFSQMQVVNRSCKDKEKKRSMHTSSEPSEQTVFSASCRATGWSLSWCWPTSRATPVWGRRRKSSHMHFLNLRSRKSNWKCDDTLVFLFVENNYAGISYSCAIMSSGWSKILIYWQTSSVNICIVMVHFLCTLLGHKAPVTSIPSVRFIYPSIHWFHNAYDWNFKTRHIQHGDLKMFWVQ